MKGNRLKRLNSLLQKELYFLIKDELKDPRIKGMITICEVDVAQDLKTAKIYVSIYGASEEDTNKTITALRNSSGFLRALLLKKLDIRCIPSINFELDTSMEHGDKVNRILKQINEKQPEK